MLLKVRICRLDSVFSAKTLERARKDSDMAPGWLQNNLMDKVMFGSNLPRFRQVRTREGLEKLPIRKDVLDKILGDNAKVFLGMEVRDYAY